MASATDGWRFERNELIVVSYLKEEKLTTGYARVRRCTEKEVHFTWFYTREDLLNEEGGPNEEDLCAIGFQPHDLSDSDLRGDASYSNVRAARRQEVTRERIRFMWDGRDLTKLEVEGDDEEEDPNRTNSENYTQEQLRQFRAYVLAQPGKQWQTEYGSKWLYVLQSLATFGQITANKDANERVHRHFFDTADDDVLPGAVTWGRPLGEQYGKCEACGCKRRLTHRWGEMAWNVGSTCQLRIEALRQAAVVLFEVRMQGQASSPYLPNAWIEQQHKILDVAWGQAQAALCQEEMRAR